MEGRRFPRSLECIAYFLTLSLVSKTEKFIAVCFFVLQAKLELVWSSVETNRIDFFWWYQGFALLFTILYVLHNDKK